MKRDETTRVTISSSGLDDIEYRIKELEDYNKSELGTNIMVYGFLQWLRKMMFLIE